MGLGPDICAGSKPHSWDYIAADPRRPVGAAAVLPGVKEKFPLPHG